MIRYHTASSAHTLLILLTGTSLFHLCTLNPINTSGDVNNPYRDTLPWLSVSGDGQRQDEERRTLQKVVAEEEEELFKDVDPKILAAVLLEALNHSQVEKRGEGEEYDEMEGDMKADAGEVKSEEAYKEVRVMKETDRNRGGREELELLMAAQRKEQEREEEEEGKKAQEEEEKWTEKVTSHIKSQTTQVKTELKFTSSDRGGENREDAAPQQGPNTPKQGSNEEEEQLSPEELKSLETMMKEFPRLKIATKRDGDSEQNQRESRGYSNYNDIIPVNKGSDLTMSKEKLKWQEETQKALNFPTFRGNFMDDFKESNYAGSNVGQTQLPVEQEVMEDDEPDKEEEDEEVLSPEEEEAQAKAEQEEIRRQAAEAQRAKMEEEKLADIASDMLLRYMVKQNNGKKKYSPSLSNAMEDKRSDEEQKVTQDDIDPQTVDKLIEISSKLHLPADDVVDIISDVEKKKKKDMLSVMTSRWQRPLNLLSSSFSSTNGFSASQTSTNQNSFPISKQPSPAVSLLKTWFQEKSPPESQGHWSKITKDLLTNQNLWPKPQKPLSVKKELWLKLPKSVWTGYHFYPYTHPSHYQRRPYPDYHPIYFHPPPRPKPHYYVPKPIYTLNNFLENSMDDSYNLPPKPNYHSWYQPQLRRPPAGLQQNPYHTSYSLPLYSRTFHPLPIPKPRSSPQMPVIPPKQNQFYYSALVPVVTRKEDYYVAQKQPDISNHDDLEKYIQQILMKIPQMLN